MDENDPRPEKPVYLRMHAEYERYINPAHVKEAQEVEEDGKTKSATYPRRKTIASGEVDPVREDIASFVGVEAFRLLTKELKSGRSKGPQSFFEKIGYLFHDWKTVDRTIDSDFKTVRYVWPNGFTEKDIVRTDDVPLMKVFRTDQADPLEENTEVYENFLQDRNELSMLVEHEIRVNPNGKADAKRTHRGKRVELWTKSVNLLNVAVRFIASFSSFDTKESPITSVLAAHTYSLKVAYNLAVVLRYILTKNGVHVRGSQGPPEMSETESSLMDIDTEGVRWVMNALLPFGSLRGDILYRVVDSVPECVFLKEKVEESLDGPLLPAAPVPDVEDSLDAED